MLGFIITPNKRLSLSF